MPKVSIVLGRRTLNVVELDRPRITIGRSPDTDIPIDNVSVSRQHAEIFRTEDGWMVKDASSANGTFLNGDRLDQPRQLKRGDEISIGKFSIFFDRVVGDTGSFDTAATARRPAPEQPPAEGTRFIKPMEIDELRQSAAERRKARLTWEAGGERGDHALPENGCLLIGRDDLCDLQTPRGPTHHLLVSRKADQWEARNLSWWHGMRVNGSKRARVTLSDGDVVEIAGLTVTYAAAVG